MPKVLIIDDDKDLLDVTTCLLNKKGYEVAVCDNLEDAIKIIESFNPQLIVLDVFLNDIDGLDICRKFKSYPETKHIPIIIFSSYPNMGETAIFEYGADDFISKPFEVDELIAKMHSVLSQAAGLA
jgi:DNA-binding response OmpR family regulator